MERALRGVRQKLDMYDQPRDEDTLGGRLSRARETAGYTETDFARTLGIKKQTLMSWETDRSEPRANRLLMISGLLGVSPAWLLHGMGESPQETLSDELNMLRAQLDRIKELRVQTDLAIANMEEAITRIARRESEAD